MAEEFGLLAERLVLEEFGLSKGRLAADGFSSKQSV